ncbi:MAG: HDOD domain-containing protein [Acidobacteriota bacterium]
MEARGKSLNALVSLIKDREMPTFARVARNITGVATREDASFTQLSEAILQDASMTSRVLRVANSAHYNIGTRSVNTISRAVVLLGFNTVRTMSLSIALIEALLQGSQRTQVAREMARAFHAAVQAKKMAASRNDESVEEIFIATLLYRLGHIAFWCFAGDMADRLAKAQKGQGLVSVESEREVLGFRLQELTIRLAREWRLSSLLELALEGHASSDPRVNCIVLGHKLAESAEKGWDSREVGQVTERIARFLGMTVKDTVSMIHSGAKEAAGIADSYGMPESGRLIPIPDDERLPLRAARDAQKFPEPDHMLQLTIMRELTTLLLDRKIDVNMLFSILLEGIFRGVGMDRVLFALLTQDRRTLRGKYGLGWTGLLGVQDFVFKAAPQEPNIFSHALGQQKPLWIKADAPREQARLITHEVREFTRGSPFFIMPITFKDRALGIIYADRQPSGRELDEESFSSFSYFGLQASMSLSSLSRQ